MSENKDLFSVLDQSVIPVKTTIKVKKENEINILNADRKPIRMVIPGV